MPIPPKARNISKSLALLKRAEKIIPAATQTFSKAPSQFVFGVAPIYLSHGRGCRVWDVDGNEYIDLCMGLWPIILGYGYPEVAESLCKMAMQGQTFSLMHPLEIEVTEGLLQINNWADMVRFGKNGSDVTTAAVKVSRAFTGRNMIARCSTSYHGWHDWYMCSTERKNGIPAFNSELCKIFDYNDIQSFKLLMEKYGNDIACVIMEGAVLTAPQDNFLQEVEKITHQYGAVLIFDEIINGFRLALGGAREYFNINADLACFGKGMANGSPLAALVGKREIMELFANEVFFSFTFGGETMGLAACKATMDVVAKNNVINYLWAIGSQLKDGFLERINHFKLSEVVVPKGYPVRTVLQFFSPTDSTNTDLNIKSLFQQEVLKRGVLLHEYHALSLSHSPEDIEYILEVYGDALKILKEAIETDSVVLRLEGQPVTPVLRRKD
jgi:glutamate-1-semialdehyde 2,1-aminomutase/spore coat polysaccharide biosynthesis protein SpsF